MAARRSAGLVALLRPGIHAELQGSSREGAALILVQAGLIHAGNHTARGAELVTMHA